MFGLGLEVGVVKFVSCIRVGHCIVCRLVCLAIQKHTTLKAKLLVDFCLDYWSYAHVSLCGRLIRLSVAYTAMQFGPAARCSETESIGRPRHTPRGLGKEYLNVKI